MDPDIEITQDDQTQQQQDNEQAAQDERKQIEAAFNGQPTETPASEEVAEPVMPEPEAPPQPKYRQITEDEWTALQSRAAEVDTLKATLEKSTGTAFGKIGGIERKLSELGSSGVKLSKDKIDRLRDDLPEIADLFDELQVKAAPAAAPDLTEVIEKAREEARRAAREEALAEQHEDWREVTAGREFAEFVRKQGDAKVAEITKASNEWNHRVIGRAIADFKASKAKAQAAEASKNQQRDRFKQAVTPRGTASPVMASKTEAEEIEAAFNRTLGR